MGLIENILIAVAHLLLVAMDIVITMILLEAVYEKRRYDALKPIAKVFTPILDLIVIRFSRLVESVTYKVYSRRTLLILLIFCMLIIRFLIHGIF